MIVSILICIHVMQVKYPITQKNYVVILPVRLVVQVRLSLIALLVKTQQISHWSFRQAHEDNVNVIFPQNGMMLERVQIVILIV